MLLAVTSLSCMFVIIKQMATELPVFVVAFARTSISLILLAPWLARVGRAGIATTRIKTHLFRSVFGIASFVCVVYALRQLLLADTMVLSFTSPLWSIIISALVLGEVIRRHRTIATIVGFLGVVLIIEPQGGIDPAMLIALFAAVLTSGAMVAMKSLSATEPPDRMVFYFFLFGTLIVLGPALATWQTPTLVQAGWLVVAGLLGAIGQAWLARAYAAADVTVVAPFDFVRLPLAALFGFLVFDEVPGIWTGIGTVVIIAASLYIAHHEARERRPNRGRDQRK